MIEHYDRRAMGNLSVCVGVASVSLKKKGCSMTPIHRVALIGNSSPRHCGIATFTSDLQQALAGSSEGLDVDIFALTDPGQSYDYPPSVRFEIREDRIEDYLRAADILNREGYDVVCLQHEFGIFGGDAGEHILALVNRLKAPLVTTLHTVLEHPTDRQRAIIQRLIQKSSKIVVMANKAQSLLTHLYGATDEKISVIAHGVPDVAFAEPFAAKAELNFAQKSVILTFGLLSPNKGVEVMIDAMPAVLEQCADAVYVVLGATHPQLKRREGEAYRERLVARAAQLNIGDHVVFKDQFVDRDTLLRYIAMCDVYVTPYLNEAQMTSGTLAYSFGLGKAVVSTPYWHAAELLADGRGRLVPFGDAQATGEAVAGLLTDPDALDAMRRGAYAASRAMTWAETGRRYAAIFNLAAQALGAATVLAPPPMSPPAVPSKPAGRQLGHLLALCDDTGLLQHAVRTTANRAHGYCVDDNARALLFSCLLTEAGGARLPAALAARFAAFIQHAWNKDLRRFRNFMSFDRRWLEAEGSEDSHGRTLWALGVCARIDEDAQRRCWAAELFADAFDVVETFTSPRAWAFTLLGLDAFCEVRADNIGASAVRRRLAHRLNALLVTHETPDWVWFEGGLAYDNARLPQALIVTGMALNDPVLTDAGLRSLTWLTALQTSEAGQFRPVGVDSFGDIRQRPRPFDQQPLEAAATVSACAAAAAADLGGAGPDWPAEGRRAFAWFLGANDLSIPLVDPETGACRDGLHFDRPNENCGAESVLSYLTSRLELRQFSALGRPRIGPSRVLRRDYDGASRVFAKPRGPSVRHAASLPSADPTSPRPGARAVKALQAGD
jgi:glycosyltransferase involved in cell wall biosynthesis